MDEFLQKMHNLYLIEQDNDKKLEIAQMFHSISQKRFPIEYHANKVNLKIMDAIILDKQSNYFLDNIDKYYYENPNLLIIEKENKLLKTEIVDIGNYWSKITQNELDLFFVKTFFLNPSYFDQFQINQFIKTLN